MFQIIDKFKLHVNVLGVLPLLHLLRFVIIND
jgi:hypothetical protein